MTGLEIVAGLATAAAGAVSAAGAMSAGKAQANASVYEAQVAQRNAKIARNQAEVDQEDQRRENRRQMGAMRAAYGSSGLELSGSPLDVLADTAIEQELDVARIGYRGELRAIGEHDKANQAIAAASNAKKAGQIGALSAVVKTGASLLSSPTAKSSLVAS